MPYTPTTWVDGVTKVGPTNMNHLETGLQTAAATADAAVPKSTVTTAGDIIYATGSAAVTRLGLGAAGTVLKGGASAPSFASVVDADVSASAAIAVSKLAAGSAGQVLGGTTPSYSYPPGYQFDRTQITSSISGINTTTEGTATTVIAGGSVTYDGSTLVKVEFFAPNLIVTTSTIVVTFVVLRAAVIVGQARYVVTVDAQGSQVAPYIVAFDTPTAASIAYTVKAFVNANTATVSAGAGGSGALLPAFLRVTKV